MTTPTPQPPAAAAEKVRYSISGGSGYIQLNRPKALNSLDQDMITSIDAAVDLWREEPSVHQIVITSGHEKAFCAGGDVRAVREAILAGTPELGEEFFTTEYRLNHKIAQISTHKPYVAIIDGIAMGGGLGVSMHGSHRIVTERASAAMPEMAIGFIPDVGITHFSQQVVSALGRPLPELARFIGLSGYRLNAADMLWAGWATHFVPSAALAEFSESMDAEGVEAALQRHAIDPTGAQDGELGLPEAQLPGWYDDIAASFSGKGWADYSPAPQFSDLLASANPESLVAAAELYRINDAPGVTLEQALANELRLGAYMRAQPNFLEGVRAVLVDKDRNAQFHPATTEEVSLAPIRQSLIGMDSR